MTRHKGHHVWELRDVPDFKQFKDTADALGVKASDIARQLIREWTATMSERVLPSNRPTMTEQIEIARQERENRRIAMGVPVQSGSSERP